MTNTSPRRAKVGLVGTGMVGASFAYALMQRGLANELVLIDANRGRAEAEAQDLIMGCRLCARCAFGPATTPILEGQRPPSPR